VGSDDLDLLAASLRADTSDVHAFVEGLAVKLEEALPGKVQVYRWRGGLMRPKRVQKIVVDGGERRLELRLSSGSVETSCSRLSAGIVLRREPVDIDEWIAALSEMVAAEAQRSAVTRQALDRLLTG
jgi:hypothetical protein